MSTTTTLPAAGRGLLLLHRGSSLVGPPSCSVSTTPPLRRRRPRRLPLRCFSTPPVINHVDAAATTTTPGKNDGGDYYRQSFADDLLLAYFRSKMVEEVGWDSEKPGYAGLIEVATRPMIKGKSASDIEQSAVRVLRSLFPTLLLDLFKALFVPIANGQLACIMVARATVLSSQWLMGRCSVNSVTLPDGKSLSSGVFVEKCRYLDESKCIGMCINTCKLPTQTFFKDHMGVDLYMEPNFEDYSCQFSFGVQPPPVDADKALKEPCLDTCSNARRHRDRENGIRNSNTDERSCTQV